MKITEVAVKNFRLLQDVKFTMEEFVTLIVGRNNSGKTSVTEIFRRMLCDGSPTFFLEDFSLGVHRRFWDAFVLHSNGTQPDVVRQSLPHIGMRVTMSYDPAVPNLGPLSEFVIDLNPLCTTAVVLICYQLKDGAINSLFEGFTPPTQNPTVQEIGAFLKELKERLPKLYSSTIVAVDPADESNTKVLDMSALRAMIMTGFVNAQRGLDDTTHKERDVLGKILERLLHTALLETAPAIDRTTARALEAAVKGVQQTIDTSFTNELANLLPTFQLFGYPGLNDPKLKTETVLDVHRLLENHTKVRYSGVNGVNLPEAYNGLGSRNLIYILLQLLDFYKSYISKSTRPNLHLIFIEEPEAHLHPQMQEVFIRKLGEIAQVLANTFNNGQPWPVQFVITTHSSHIANEASFSAIRYFLSKHTGPLPDSFGTCVKDLKCGMAGIPADTLEFLHQYMTLTRCDLLFADKAVLIEGTSERLLMPQMIKKVDALSPASNLSSQYVSVVEVGGAHAHRFFPLLEFLEIRTLIVSDLDSTKSNGSGRYISCKVSEGERTSNACIKEWFEDPQVIPRDLLTKSDADKTKGILRLAFQVPEDPNAPCGRSLEAAFMLANMGMFGIDGDSAAQEEAVWGMTSGIDKTDFALEHGIAGQPWVVPSYIASGLKWLAGPIAPRGGPATAPAASPVAAQAQRASAGEEPDFPAEEGEPADA